jgi:hypothetical protein
MAKAGGLHPEYNTPACLFLAVLKILHKKYKTIKTSSANFLGLLAAFGEICYLHLLQSDFDSLRHT